MITIAKLLANKYVLGALALTIALAVIFGYGWYEHKQGWNERDTAAQIEAAKLNQAAMDEQTRLTKERDDADQKFQTLKTDTTARAADLDATLGGLRAQLAYAKKHPAPGTDGGTHGADTDWIGIAGTCWGDYADLAKEAATYADRVNGLQGYVRAIRPKLE